MKKRFYYILLTSILSLFVVSSLILLPSCSPKNQEIILATTTSTYDSGLLDQLIPPFEEETGYRVKPVAVGTGEALAMGRRGEADILLVHSREAEDEFVQQGYGTERKDVMYNDFIIIGPASDPLNIEGLQAVKALAAISDGQLLFISRGDNSGTHAKEISIWEKAGIDPGGDWYMESGQGMGETLRIANEKQAYTLTDRGTYLAQESNLDLVVLVEGDDLLFNPYGVICVNYEKFESVNINYEGAMAFANFITSSRGQAIIEEFGIDKFGQPLFYPDAK
ncbi:MAG: substrate-binding domain-containing protein [Actinomycetota bacterium]